MIIKGYPNPINITFDGNSIVFGQGVTTSQRFSDLLLIDSNLVSYFGSIKKNIGVGGQTTGDMIGRQAGFLYPNLQSNFRKNVVVFWEIRNDLYFGSTSVQAYTNVLTYCNNAKANGFDVILCTETPSTAGTPVNGNAQLEIDRLAVRSSILADFTLTSSSLIYKPNSGITYADVVVDVGGDATMGNVANCSNVSLYQDGTHPTATGHSNIAAIIKRGLQYYLTLQR